MPVITAQDPLPVAGKSSIWPSVRMPWANYQDMLPEKLRAASGTGDKRSGSAAGSRNTPPAGHRANCPEWIPGQSSWESNELHQVPLKRIAKCLENFRSDLPGISAGSATVAPPRRSCRLAGSRLTKVMIRCFLENSLNVSRIYRIPSRFLQGIFPYICSEKSAAHKHMTDITEILLKGMQFLPTLIQLVTCFVRKEKTTIINKKKQKKKKKRNKNKN